MIDRGNIVALPKTTRNLYTTKVKESCKALSAFTFISAIRLPNTNIWCITYA